jgi:tetraacyldisaccharide-1-P 4'-kinase
VNARTGRTATVPRGAQSALVCGIARPERFVAMVRRMGIEPKEHLVRPDHHVFAHEEIRGIAGRGHTHILTTHKDACRLCAINLVDGPDICYLRITPAFLEERQERELRESVLCTAARNSG